ncbi:cyclin [Flagelloscypha sp. PMI_526]|nr:cyclin [Flagelloscypha sp. PMI_526]
MKDVSAARYPRALAYPKKRPQGVSKHKTPALASKRSPRSAKASLQQAHLRARDAQIAALRAQGLFLEEEYRDEIRVYMHEMEYVTSSSPSCMDQQPEIKWHMRPCHFSFRLRPETLYLTLNIIDRYVSRRVVFVKHYQLVGCAALWIAAKFEDAKERVPTVQDLVQVCRDTYDESAFIQMEGHVLSTIEWTLGHPTAEAWLRVLTTVARFLMEITLFYREFIKYSPSTIATASLTLARALCGAPRRLWEETQECIEVETVVKKYSYAFYSKAATFVVQYYLQGGRFVHHQPSPHLPLPVTPSRLPSTPSTAMSTPMGSVSSLSDMSDDMPLTPSTPPSSSDAFTVSFMTPPADVSDKENAGRAAAMLGVKTMSDVPQNLLPHDYVQLGRTALNSLNNIASPRPTTLVS